MRATYVVAAAVLLALSLACIATTVVKMAQGHWTMGSWHFWAAIIFHPVTALAALLLLCAARPGPTAAQEPAAGAAGQPPSAEEGQP